MGLDRAWTPLGEQTSEKSSGLRVVRLRGGARTRCSNRGLYGVGFPKSRFSKEALPRASRMSISNCSSQTFALV